MCIVQNTCLKGQPNHLQRENHYDGVGVGRRRGQTDLHKVQQNKKTILIRSVADPAGPDPGSRIPNPYFLELNDKCLVKKSYNSLKIGPNFFLQHFKNKIIFNFVKFVKFVKFVATKKGMRTDFFSPLPFVEVFGTEIRDPRSGILIPGWVRNQDPGSEIRIIRIRPQI